LGVREGRRGCEEGRRFVTWAIGVRRVERE
jgi:hypothetical protein